jgi:crossover junction endonuclease MUS81
MIIKVDTREPDLLQKLNYLLSSVPNFKNIIVKSETLPIGDIIICDETEAKPEEKLIIERKSISDLLSSIKDGRYEEQSYRLNGLNHHNHNIVYLVEGDVNKNNYFKSRTDNEKLMAYSAMFSLNYYKGFSVFRSFSLEETALIICNMAYKLEKEASGKKAFYKNNFEPSIETNLEEKLEQSDEVQQSNMTEQSEKDYVNVVKKVKKENITPDNIGEIMLCQIPGISSVTALAIMEQYKNLPNLIKELEINNDCLKDISSTNPKGQIRKINKTSLANIVKFLLKK